MIERDIYGLDDEISNMTGYRNPPPPPPEKSKDLWDFEWERKRWKEQTRWWQKTKTKMSKEEILYIGNALMWFVICWTPIILYVKYYTRNINQNK